MKPEFRTLLTDAAAALGVTVGGGEADRLLAFGDELLRWNRKVNLTAITREREVVLKHLADSCAVVPFLPEAGRIVDLGSGGGFPAIVIGILRPGLEVLSVDSVEKKIFFQRHAARLLGLANVVPVHVRAEDLASSHAGYFDAAVSRAFAALPLFVRLARPLVREGGALVAMKGKEGREEAEAAVDHLAAAGVELARIAEFTLPGAGDARSIVVLRRKEAG